MWINGEPSAKNYDHVAELVEALVYRTQCIAVEVNGEIIPRKAWADTTLQSEDKVEIVQFVGGG